MPDTSYPTRKHPRLKTYDYSTAGMYFITICVKNRLPLLGRVVDGAMRLSPAGTMVVETWNDIPSYYQGVDVDAFVAMPNHVHGIVVLPDRDGLSTPRTSLPEVIQRFKSLTTKRYIVGVTEQRWPRFPGQLWQTSFFERVIRDDQELYNAQRYIGDNPQQWALDQENPDREVG